MEIARMENATKKETGNKTNRKCQEWKMQRNTTAAAR